jgi:putative tryptophan/tyrosine transport system substrate-binding protein
MLLSRHTRRREFMMLIGGAATTWVRSAHAQSSLPVIGFIDAGSTKRNPELMAAFVRGLAENGFVVDRNVTIEARSSGGDERMLPGVVKDLVRRNVAVITTPAGAAATMAAKAATTSIPIAFLVAIDPVVSGLVTSLSHPGGNLTGVTTLNVEVAPKRLEVLHELLPQAKTFALLVNPTNAAKTAATVRDLHLRLKDIRQRELTLLSTGLQ